MSVSESKQNQTDQQYNNKGWLNKWTNYIKGYQKRWFVLQNGLLSYYRNQAEVAHTCRGTINLANAFIHTEDSCSFVITNGGAQTFHLKANSEVERQRWVTALELAKDRAIRTLESDEDEEISCEPDKNELQNTLKILSAKLEDLNTCNDLINKHGAALQRALGDLEQLDLPVDPTLKIKSVNERATLFRITSNAMINACADYYDVAEAQGKRWQKVVQYEHDQRLRLEEMVETLARQHSNLEKQARKSQNILNPIPADGANSESEEDFFDAEEPHSEEFKVCLPPPHLSHRRTGSGVSMDSVGANFGPTTNNYDSSDSDSSEREADVISSNTNVEDVRDTHKRQSSQDSGKSVGTANVEAVQRKRRTRIPEKPNYSVNLWSIMKNSIGKDLTKIPMPVNFSEPLSMLQRLTEDFEYADILDRAAKCDDSTEQLAYVAAFTNSSYATTSVRTGKPFNPLLGETFECDHTSDKGWRSIAEQVCHHPPMVAMHTEGRGWKSWQEFTMSSKFRGKYLQIIPLGIAHLVFPKSGNHYTWRKVTTTVHNIIVGKLWVDNHGEMDIRNHYNGDNCHLKYSAYSYFSRETPRKVTGVVTNSAGAACYVVQGTWDDHLEGARVLKTTENNRGKTVYETSPQKKLWQRHYPPNFLEKCYNFTQLAIELNEREEGVATSDSRNRPDQRFMEEGSWDEANKTKIFLEEKQRAVRRRRETEAAAAAAQGQEYQPYQPKWFRKDIDPQTGNPIHLSTGEYWQCKEKQDWQRCPDIYL